MVILVDVNKGRNFQFIKRMKMGAQLKCNAVLSLQGLQLSFKIRNALQKGDLHTHRRNPQLCSAAKVKVPLH